MVIRSDIDVYTYKSIKIPKYGDGRDLLPVGWKEYLSPPYGNPLYKCAPNNLIHF